MSQGPTRISISLFAIWLITSVIVCVIITAVINMLIPYHFESTAVVASNERFDGEQSVSPTQAELIERELGSARLGIDSEAIRNSIRLRRIPQGVEINVRTKDRYTSREIAMETARRFRSVKHERELTENPPSIKPLSEADPVVLDDTEAIRNLLISDALEAGVSDFLEVPSEAAAGNPKAAALLAHEDFQRRFARYRELSSILGLDGVPGEPFSRPLPLLSEPMFAKRPNPDMPRILAPAGQLVGIILGIILGLKFGRKPVEPFNGKPKTAPASAPTQTPDSPDEW